MSFKLKNLLFGVTAGLALAVAAQSAVADTLDTIQPVSYTHLTLPTKA